MDSSLSKSFQLFFLSLALLWCFTFADLIRDICSSARNSRLCSEALRSDPRSRGADLKFLEQISIDLTSRSAKLGAALVKQLRKGAKDPTSRGIYDSCLESYEDSIETLGECIGDLKAGDYQGVTLKASAVETDIDTCDDGFKESRKTEPARLKQISRRAQDLSNVVLVISNKLQG